MYVLGVDARSAGARTDHKLAVRSSWLEGTTVWQNVVSQRGGYDVRGRGSSREGDWSQGGLCYQPGALAHC